VDPNANGQHDPLQRQKASLEKNQAQALNPPNVPLRPFRHRDIDGVVTSGNVASVSSIGGSNQRASVDDSIRGEMEEDGVLTGCAKNFVLSLLLENHTCYRSFELKFEP